jgi:Uma2 family endonuclease
LVVEVTASTASYDLHDKLRAYRRNGVQEYIAWRVLDSAIDWFSLQNDEYVRLEPDEEGMIESRVFPGLWLDVPAMLSGDLAGVLKKLQEGLASTEHTGLLERLGTAPDSGAAV